jgi:hypothetical protein
MIKLIDILREAKQVGTLYHFTSIKRVIDILQHGYLRANKDGQVSTTRNASFDITHFDVYYHEDQYNIARFVFDGDKVSTKYKIKPFYFSDGDNKGRGSGYDQEEEQIIVNGGDFYFFPYLKRIDLFITYPEDENIFKVKDFLDNMNISYKIYNHTSSKGISYNQNKEGNPKDIINIPQPKIYSKEELLFNHKPAHSYDIYLYNIDGDNIKQKVYDFERSDDILITKWNTGKYFGLIEKNKENIYKEYHFDRKGNSIKINISGFPWWNQTRWRQKWIHTDLKKFDDNINAMFSIDKKDIDIDDIKQIQ